jgi:hypothetical protein
VAPLLGPKCSAISSGQYQCAGKLRRECFSAGKVFEAPTNVIALTVSTARHMAICKPALTVKCMHVIEAAAEAALWNHYLDHNGNSRAMVFAEGLPLYGMPANCHPNCHRTLKYLTKRSDTKRTPDSQKCR